MKLMKRKSADEQSKKAVAKRVISAKRRYFMPKTGTSVEADSLDEATKQVTKQESGDGK